MTSTKQPEMVRRVEGLFALADQLEVRLAKARRPVDQPTPPLFAPKLVPKDPTDKPAEILLERIRVLSVPSQIPKGR